MEKNQKLERLNKCLILLIAIFDVAWGYVNHLLALGSLTWVFEVTQKFIQQNEKINFFTFFSGSGVVWKRAILVPNGA